MLRTIWPACSKRANSLLIGKCPDWMRPDSNRMEPLPTADRQRVELLRPIFLGWLVAVPVSSPLFPSSA